MTPSVVRRGLATAALTALALSGLSACGSKDSSTAPSSGDTPSASAAVIPTTTDATPTPAGGSATPTPTEDTATASAPTAPTGGTSLSADAFATIFKDALDKATTANITLKTTGKSALSGTGQIDFTKSPPEIAAKLNSSAFGGQAEVRLVGNAFYIQVPQLGQKFITYKLDDPKNPFSSLISNSLDPSSLVDVLRKGITSATLVGTEDGLEHYDLMVDSSAILAEYPPSVRSQAAGLLPKSVEYNMFFDDSGLLRRTVFDLGGAGTTTQSYDDWGTKVDIQAPPASDITTIPTS